MQSSAGLRSQLGYQTDQYGRQYQMTPQVAGTATPTGGAAGWMQGQSLGGAPHGLYVQSNLPSPAAGMAPEQKTAFLAQRGWQLGGDGQITNHPGITGRIRPDGGLSLVGQPPTSTQLSAGSQRYNDLKTRRQQMSDQRIIARAKMRGLGQNTPAVRAAMQRQGMLAQGQPGQPAGQQPAAPGVAQPVPGQVSARNVQRWSSDPFVVGSLGTDYASSTPENFRRAFGMAKTPADHQKIAEAWRDRVAMEPEIASQFNKNPAMKREFDAFMGGIDSWKRWQAGADQRAEQERQQRRQDRYQGFDVPMM